MVLSPSCSILYCPVAWHMSLINVNFATASASLSTSAARGSRVTKILSPTTNVGGR